MEPLDLFRRIQPLVQQEIKQMMDSSLREDKYSTSEVQIHTHNGTDSVRFPLENLIDAVQYVAQNRITLTPAQVKALNTTPITIVPAPVKANLGGNAATTPKAFTIVLGIAARLSYAGTAYTGANNLEFRYTNGSGAKVTTDMSSAFLNTAGSAYDFAPAVGTELTPVANAPIVVSVPVANPGAGNSPLTLVVHYRTYAFNT